MGNSTTGICYLVGAGPGDLGLVTRKAESLIRNADVLVYDYLANPELLTWAPDQCEILYVGKKEGQHTIPQGEINQRLVEICKSGRDVVRLKGGDPYVFGRGGEEVEELVAEGVQFEVVPAVTSGVAAPAYAGIPVTHRDQTSSVIFLTGHEDPTKPQSRINWQALVDCQSTLVIYMGIKQLSATMSKLMAAGLAPSTPVALVQWGTYSRQRSVLSDVENVVADVEKAGIKAPAITIVGGVAGYRETLGWFEKRPLLGKRFLLTRTRKQSSRLRSLLEEQGAEVWELPTISVKPKPFSLPAQNDSSGDQWLVFTSPNAVDFFFDHYFQENDIRDLAGVKIAAVGPATTKKIAALHLKVDFQPSAYTANDLVSEWPGASEDLVCFPCGNLAGKEIEEGLSQVHRLEVYETTPASDDGSDRLNIRQRLVEEGVDWVVFASSSAVENFDALKLPIDKISFKCATLGPVTAKSMEAFGYHVDFMAEEATMDSLVQGLISQVNSL